MCRRLREDYRQMWAKTILVTLFVYILMLNGASKQSIREMFAKSVNNKQTAQNLLQLLAKQDQSAFVIGYTGATKMLMAKHVINPFTKFSNFNAGKRLLNAAIVKDKTDVELVFLRYATQVSAPAILGYNNHIETDKKYIFQYLNKKEDIDEKLTKTIVSFMKQQELTTTERQFIEDR